MKYPVKHLDWILRAMILLSWLTLPFLGWKNIKRFTPSTLFISFVIMIESKIAEKRRWWVIYVKLFPNLIGETPLIIGPFFAGSLWILKLTYGKFPLYFLLNLLFDTFFVYPFYSIGKRIGFFSLINMKRYQLLLLFLWKSLLMYGAQLLVEHKKPKQRKLFF